MTASSRLYSVARVQELDRRTLETGVPGFSLMMEAGRAAFDEVRRRWPERRRWCVFCGAGHNAGDGYVVAGLAARLGLAVQLVALREPQTLDGAAAEAVTFARHSGVDFTLWRDETAIADDTELVVDALLGIGLAGEVRSPFDRAIAMINRAGRPVVALDLPSGLDGDTGALRGETVRADLTVTFIAKKFGLYTGAAPDVTGEIVLAPLSLDRALLASTPPQGELMAPSRPARTLPPRTPTTHKGHCGHLLVVGGQPGFGGATLMSAETAARLGAGLVSLATDAVHIAPALARCPELMVSAVRSGLEIEALLQKATAVLIGPGLGQSAWGQGLMQAVMNAPGPRIVDADALHLLAREEAVERREDRILTPHPGEAAMLLGVTTDEVQKDRLTAARALWRRYGGVIVLKGAGTLVLGAGSGARAATEWPSLHNAPPGEADLRCLVSRFGNPGMASGGMGDVLGGIIASLLVQGLSCFEAAATGVLVHALAADDAACDGGERGLLASDLAGYARRRVNWQSLERTGAG